MAQTKEIWKPVPGYNNYHVSNLGRVKSLRCQGGRILKQNENNKGYLSVNITGKKRYRVHRLVMCAFNNKPLDYNMFVCHKDDNVKNNKLDNLFFGSHQDNVDDKVKKCRQAMGEKLPQAKLTNDDVILIRDMYATGKYSHRKLAEIFSVSKCPIQQILSGKGWKHVP